MDDDDEETFSAAPCKGRPLDHFYDWLNDCTLLDENESSYAVGEYIEYLFYKDSHNLISILKCPQTGIYEVWLYELARLIIKLLNYFVGAMMKVCSRESCDTMIVNSNESVQILCAAHHDPRNCCAIDYCTHTLNAVTKTINDSTYFPSRMSVKLTSIELIKTPFRRLYRILLHAFCRHPEIIEHYQREYSLVDIFSNYLLKLQVINETDLIIPYRFIDSAESPDSSSD